MMVTAAVVGGTLAAGAMQAGAASDAAQTQADAARNAQNIGLQEFNTITGQEAPYMQSGYGALNALDWALGITPQTAMGSTPGAYSPQPSLSQSYGGGQFPIGGGGAFGNLGMQSPLKGAMPVTRGATANGIDPSSGYRISPGGGISQAIAGGIPGGVPAGHPASSAGGLGFGSLTQPFTLDQFYNFSPAYQFQKQQGTQGVLNADASGQGALSGSALKDLISYNQGLAGTSFGNAFNQYQTQQGNIFSRLSNIAQLGQNAAANTGQQGTALAGQMGQSAQNIGTALAGGQVGAANAWSGAINSAAPWLSSYAGGGNSIPDLVAGGGTTNTGTISGGQFWPG
jgi:hypothetical protein